MNFPELQDDNKYTKKLRSEKLLESYKNIKQVLYYQGLLYIPKVIYSELISRYHDNLFIGHFDIEKIQKLIARKYIGRRYEKMLMSMLKVATFV